MPERSHFWALGVPETGLFQLGSTYTVVKNREAAKTLECRTPLPIDMSSYLSYSSLGSTISKFGNGV
jgi:hypothetical protein